MRAPLGPQHMTEDQSQYDGHDLEALFELRNYQQWIAQKFAPYLKGDTAEFGAGIGAVSQWLVPHVDHLDVIEPSANLIERLHQRLEGSGKTHIVNTSLQGYIADTVEGSLDTAVMVNLLEHIEDDVAVLADLRPLLRPDGHLLIFVPAMPALYSKLDKIVGHYRRYSRDRLRTVVVNAGYEIVMLRYFDLLGVFPWWLVNTLGGKDHFDAKLSGLYDRVGVPFTRFIESLCSPPIGKNLILVARRLSD